MLRILVPFYNCARYLPQCLRSLQTQEGVDFRVYLMDDVSTDGSFPLALQHSQGDSRFELIRNPRKMWQVGNYDQICQRGDLDDDDVCITVDGDDWLPDPGVFSRIAKVYEDPGVWLTWGNFRFWPRGDNRVSCAQPCDDVTTCRSIPWQFSHLRTFRTFLWRRIKPADLRDVDGSYVASAGDLAFMLPMLEMCGNEHAKYLPQVNYIYNEQNPIGDGRSKFTQQERCAALIRSRPRYARLANDRSTPT